ncbi:MAG: glycosyltransferase family 4 protein [Actinomycetales bacterium]|nr:glycosyltransferase family 4 protein [Actinomycetales bacterium]
MIEKALNIGIVCPYGWDAPGGVQAHIADLRHYLVNKGHSVSVLAPTADEDALPDWVVSAGKPLAIPYNGAVARVLFGPIAFAKVKQWISENEFDLLHLHEPAIPSIALLACWAAEGPMVGTFHASAKKQKASFAIVPILEPVIEKLSARIAVSEAARETLIAHLETDAVVIPNGIYAKRMIGKVRPEWSGETLGFMGRFNEPRKGLKVLIDALPIISRFMPNVRVLVAGPGDSEEFLKDIDPQLRSRIQFLGRLTEEEKADFMSSVGAYVGPNTGGESFGIILAEALAGGAAVVASDIPAFAAVLQNGKFGRLFKSEDSTDLAKVIIDLLRDRDARDQMAKSGQEYAQKFDWDEVARDIFEVYEMAIVGNGKVGLVADNRPWNRIWNR